jgi:hypothetical protein
MLRAGLFLPCASHLLWVCAPVPAACPTMPPLDPPPTSPPPPPLPCSSLREELVAEGAQPPKPLVAVRPADSLAAVVRTLLERRCSMAPVLAAQADGGRPGAGAQGAVRCARLRGAGPVWGPCCAAACLLQQYVQRLLVSGRRWLWLTAPPPFGTLQQAPADRPEQTAAPAALPPRPVPPPPPPAAWRATCCTQPR